MAASIYLANALLDHVLRGVTYTAPSRVYVSLHTADPAGTGANEVSLAAWPDYVRMDPADAAAVASGFDAAASKATENAKEMAFPAMDGVGPLTITHFAIWDAATSGNCLIEDDLTVEKILYNTDELLIRVGELDVSIT
ncbi:phage tail fiber protein [Allomesorhizobium alhagi]|uniref:Uncharacterized protein n=1 Tax=Mesorhizobium alhagi CCNWXJ12-2 TaxID=1107882 RepID=H0HNI2_9HYPH|nr:hypothetical protein [Mesorhizobium alhagi]EHK57635.1 hypothetical protein MAXJ12_08524 [Mesorhizobium alhagi CCNWXJ12-2]